MLRPASHGDLFCFALQFGQSHRMLSRKREEEESDSDDGELKKKEVLEVESIPLLYIREVGSTKSSIARWKTHPVNFYEKAVYFWRKAS